MFVVEFLISVTDLHLKYINIKIPDVLKMGGKRFGVFREMNVPPKKNHVSTHCIMFRVHPPGQNRIRH
jgi:hypothetical protein